MVEPSFMIGRQEHGVNTSCVNLSLYDAFGALSMKEPQKSWPDYDEFDHQLFVASTPFSGAYIHGMMVALLCVGGKSWQEIGAQLLTDIPTLAQGTINTLFNTLLSNSAAGLAQTENSLTFMLPHDDENIAIRIEALIDWCEGFLDGVNKANLSEQFLNNPLVKEVLSDIERIKSVSTDVLDNEENEKDYVEVVEFIRVSVLLIYEQAKQNQIAAKRLH